MSVAAEIVHDVLGATEGTLQIDHPILSVKGPEPSGEGFGLCQKLEVPVEVELALLKGLFESVDELAAKEFTQHFLGQEVVVAGAHPAGVIGREATSRHDTMHVGVSGELLAPRMQDTEEADLGAEVSGIASDFPQRFGTGAEQEIVEDSLVLQHQWHQPVREREDHVQVAGGQKFSLTGSDPTIPSGGLTLRAMAIATAVVGDGGPMSAAHALIEMAAQSGGPTPGNRSQHFDVLPTEPVAIPFDEGSSRSADQIGHLEGWPAHLLFQLQRVQRTRGRVEMALRKMQVDRGLF